jgi:hypothetical protein
MPWAPGVQGRGKRSFQPNQCGLLNAVQTSLLLVSSESVYDFAVIFEMVASLMDSILAVR